jgi:hypothetical protein
MCQRSRSPHLARDLIVRIQFGTLQRQTRQPAPCADGAWVLVPLFCGAALILRLFKYDGRLIFSLTLLLRSRRHISSSTSAGVLRYSRRAFRNTSRSDGLSSGGKSRAFELLPDRESFLSFRWRCWAAGSSSRGWSNSVILDDFSAPARRHAMLSSASAVDHLLYRKPCPCTLVNGAF